ncbi:autotransporter domain-containing protein, partial [Klebsiella pneumoniae]|nr:autotransporter domain-containing protein [Klebsiella pneumoniae]
GGAYTWNDVSTSRGVSFPGFAEVLKSGSDLGTAQVFADLGYDIAVGAFAFEPYAAVAYVNLSGGDFHETWGAAALTGFSSNSDTT